MILFVKITIAYVGRRFLFVFVILCTFNNFTMSYFIDVNYTKIHDII